MSVKAQTLFKMVCDHEGCTAEVESYDGGALVFPTIAEAKADAYDHDWTADEYGLDFCDQHREDAYQESADPCPVCGRRHPGTGTPGVCDR